MKTLLERLFTRPAAQLPCDDLAWRALCVRSPWLGRYPQASLGRLATVAAMFLHEKTIEAAGGLALDDDMALVVAAQACAPVLDLGLDWYRGWRAIVLYPDDFVARHEYVDEDGLVHAVEEPRSGEAWDSGPVVLSYGSVEAGFFADEWGSVVVHEMAHKLDLLNGTANGMPPLGGRVDRDVWTRVLTRAYEALPGRLAAGTETVLDEYATEDPAEFFAVASEAFFTDTSALALAWPDLFTVLHQFYRQHPGPR